MKIILLFITLTWIVLPEISQAAFKQRPSKLRVTLEEIEISPNENMGLLGTSYLLRLNKNIYTGLGIYSAVTGERGGFCRDHRRVSSVPSGRRRWDHGSRRHPYRGRSGVRVARARCRADTSGRTPEAVAEDTRSCLAASGTRRALAPRPQSRYPGARRGLRAASIGPGPGPGPAAVAGSRWPL